MKKLIAVTGKIASGKSKAIELLKHRKNNYFNLKYINLDIFCNDIKPNIKNLNEFLLKHCGTDHPQPEDIIEQIINNPDKYTKYCQFFNEPIIKYLNDLDDGIYIVEASALFSYPDIYTMMDTTIVIDPSEEIRNRNLKYRNIKSKIFDHIFDNSLDAKFKSHKFSWVSLCDGTLLELRAKFEYELIKCLYDLNVNEKYLIDFNKMHLEYVSYYCNNPYHNINHTFSVLNDLVFSGNYNPISGMVALFHDIVYDPIKNDNEERSCSITNLSLNRINYDKSNIEIIKNLILQTKYKTITKEIESFFLSDISHWSKTIDEIIEVEKLIFKEYSHVDFPTYKTKRLEILNNFKSLECLTDDLRNGIDISINWLKAYQPKIGWFCGSFNPFTIGHLDILKKAEKMFDKVVIVQAINPSKTTYITSLEQYSLKFYEKYSNVENMIELLSSVEYNPTLIRGIRNNQDVHDSDIWINCIKEYHPDVECCMILGDKKLNHISSSFVRNAENLNLNIKKFLVD